MLGGKSMKKFNFYPHSGSGNHGCEAIIRSTVDLFPQNDIVVFTNHPEEALLERRHHKLKGLAHVIYQH